MSEAAGVTVRTSGAVAPAFDDFYARERTRLVRAVALAIGDVGEAADVVDEAMARALHRWSSVGDYAHPAGWVYRVAVNLARSRWRRARRLVLRSTPPEEVAERDGARPVDRQLWDAVAQLPAGQRDAIVLRFVLDWDHARIASALDIEESSARSRVTRGIAALRATLEVQP